MATEAEKIQRRNIAEAYANGVADFAKHFGNVAAALVLGIILGLFLAWVAWLFWLGAIEHWTVLVSPTFIAAFELAAIFTILGAWRLLRRRSGRNKVMS
jgi:uncharacterized membrane protein YozB (DUF420 family)